MYRCPHDRAPQNLADHLIPASDAAPRRLRLRSANLNRLTVPHCWLRTYGSRAFYHACPTVWNSLPDELRNSDTFDGFKRFLKTILFSRYYCDQCIIIGLVTRRAIQIYVFTTRSYAKHGLAMASRMSVCPSITLWHRDHIGWNYSKIFRYSLFVDPNITIYSKGNIQKFLSE